MSPPRLLLGGVPVDRVTAAGALDCIAALVARGGRRRLHAQRRSRRAGGAKRGFAAAYRRADLSLADGMPVVWASRLLGRPVPEKISGSGPPPPARRAGGEPRLARLPARRSAGRGRRGGAAVKALFPTLTRRALTRPCSRASPAEPASASRAGTAARRPARSALVALGAPKQELWIDRDRKALRPAVAVGIGAALDFVTGRARRRPASSRERASSGCGGSGSSRAGCGGATWSRTRRSRRSSGAELRAQRRGTSPAPQIHRSRSSTSTSTSENAATAPSARKRSTTAASRPAIRARPRAHSRSA